MEWPALTLLRLGSGHRLRVISEVVSLSLFALEVTDPVCIRKFYSACKAVTCTICACLYASERCVFGLG